MDHTELKRTLHLLFPTLKEKTLDSLVPFCAYKHVSKQTKILSEGKHHPYSYVILTGAAKSYYFKDAKEVCIWFAFENEAIGSMATFQGLPSRETVESLEETDLIQLQIEELKELAQRELAISQLVSEMILEHAMFVEEKLRQLQFMTAQERYTTLLDKTPGILQRVSLTDIASYLGVSRETLSRIRAMK